MAHQLEDFILMDCEFANDENLLPKTLCVVTKSLKTGKTTRWWVDEVGQKCPTPFINEKTVLVAYYAAAECKNFKQLGWELPKYILDPFIQYRADTSGCFKEGEKPDFSILGCLKHYNLSPEINHDEKDKMRQLALRPGGHTPEEKEMLLDYCESDVEALYQLLTNPQSTFRFDEKACLWGNFMIDVAKMEETGIPVDETLYTLLKQYGPDISSRLRNKINKKFPVFIDNTFKKEAFQKYVDEHNIPWKQKNGQPLLQQNYVDSKIAEFPELNELFYNKRLCEVLSRLKLDIGKDGYARSMASPFASKTGRSQPSSSKNVFGQPSVLRRLIRPKTEKAIAYCDWEQQEFGTAAALSKDPNMLAAYSSGDPYLHFGKLAGIIPPNGTKKSHPNEREQFKRCILGVQYGMTPHGLKNYIKCSLEQAKQLLNYHQKIFSTFWTWSDNVENTALQKGGYKSRGGWPIHISDPETVNTRTLRNFPMQANGADMLRAACFLYRDSGYKICTTVHDAILIEADDDKIEDAVAKMQAAMTKASSLILGGYELRSNVKIIRYPDRYIDERDDGTVFNELMTIIEEIKKGGDSHD